MQIVDLSLANICWYMLVDSCCQTLTRSAYKINIPLTHKLLNYRSNMIDRLKTLLDHFQHRSGKNNINSRPEPS